MKYKPLANLKGVGEVYDGNNKLAEARYELVIEQEATIAESFSGTEEIDGLQSGTGSILVKKGRIGLLNTVKKLTLHIDDGRKVDFFVTNGDANVGRFPIKLSGSFY